MSMSSHYTETWLSGPQDTSFYTRMYNAENPTSVLVFLHGAAEHAGRYTDMHNALAQQGISVFVFDLRGFGRTALDKENRSSDSAYGKTDRESQLDDVEWAIEHVQVELGALPIFLMGASLGGGLALSLMCDVNRATHKALIAVHGVIAGSPCITVTKTVPKPVLWIVRALAVVNPYMIYPIRNKPQDLSRNPVTNAQYLADPLVKTPGSIRSILDMLDIGAYILSTSYINWPKDVPVLFLHGTPDPVTSCESAKALFDKLPATDKKMITYPGAYHELHNEPDGVRETSLQDIVDFIKSHVA